MRNPLLLIFLPIIFLISACSPLTPTTTLPPSATPTPVATLLPSSTLTLATSIMNAYMIKDVFGDVRVTTFPRNQPVIRLVVVAANAQPETKVTAAWTVVDVGEPELANLKLGEVAQSPNDNGVAIFTMKIPDSGVWPAGKYKVEVYLNDKLDRTVEFTIE